MKLKDWLCAPEQSAKLQPYLADMSCEFIWTRNKNDSGEWELWGPNKRSAYTYKLLDWLPAWSGDELGVMLPESIHYGEGANNQTTHISYLKLDRQIKCYKFLYPYVISGNIFSREAHAKADLLIHLLERKIIKPEEIKL